MAQMRGSAAPPSTSWTVRKTRNTVALAVIMKKIADWGILYLALMA
jgi:hypothetical protein